MQTNDESEAEQMQFLLEYKWTVLLCLEVISFSALILFFYAHYWLKSRIIAISAIVISFATGGLPKGLLAFFDFWEHGRIGFFEILVLLLGIYSLTIGKKHILYLDKRISSWADAKHALREKK